MGERKLKIRELQGPLRSTHLNISILWWFHRAMGLWVSLNKLLIPQDFISSLVKLGACPTPRWWVPLLMLVIFNLKKISLLCFFSFKTLGMLLIINTGATQSKKDVFKFPHRLRVILDIVGAKVFPEH